MNTIPILIASWLEPELVDELRAVDARLNILHEPDLIAPPRFPSDHYGQAIQRTPDQERRWQELLAQAEILFDFDRTHLRDLPELTPRLKWVQATSSGIGQLVHRYEYARRMPGVRFTTARGIHAQPLAEFVTYALVSHTRRMLYTRELQERREWTQFAGSDLRQRTLVIVGLGAIGVRVAEITQCLGMRVVGVKNRPEGIEPRSLHVDELHPASALPDLLPRAEFLVLIAPHTPDSEGMIGAQQLAALPRGAVLINIGRGALVDEAALAESLRSEHLAAAYLDVFAQEPLPPESPLWGMPNVVACPHSASTSDQENRLITELFGDNLRRYLAGETLRNVLRPGEFY